jgi:hypothetical protein
MKRIAMLLAAAAVALLTSAAQAGLKCGTTVYVDQANRFAGGRIGDARNSSDPYQSVQCYVMAWTTSNTPYLICNANSSTNAWGGCWSQSPQLIATAAGISGDSAVFFYWDANNQCTEIMVDNASCYAPKQP